MNAETNSRRPRVLGSRETGLQALEQIESRKCHSCVQLHTVERVSDKVVQPWGQGSRRRWWRRGYVQACKKVGDEASTLAELGCRLMSMNLYGVTGTNLISVANKRTGDHGSPRSGYVKVIAIDLGTPRCTVERGEGKQAGRSKSSTRRGYSSESPRRCRSESDIFIKVVYTSDWREQPFILLNSFYILEDRSTYDATGYDNHKPRPQETLPIRDSVDNLMKSCVVERLADAARIGLTARMA